MLVGAFQIQINREFELCVRFDDGVVRSAGIKPDIQCIRQFFVILGFIAKQFGSIQRKPSFNALLLYFLCYLLEQFQRAWMRHVSFFMHKKRHRNAPVALA